MLKSANKRVLLFIGVALFLSSLSYLLFFSKIKLPFLPNYLGDIGEIYAYRTEGNINKFSTYGYITKTTESTFTEIEIYNQNILENIKKTFEIENSDEIENSSNYKITFTTNNRFTPTKITLEPFSEEELNNIVLENLFKSMNTNIYGYVSSDMLNQLTDFPERGEDNQIIAEDLLPTEEEVEYKMDLLKLYVSQLLLQKDDIELSFRNNIENYIEEHEKFFSLDVSKYKCLTSNLLEEQYTPPRAEGLDEYLDTENIRLEDLISTLYYENSEETEINEDIKIFLDKVLYCNIENKNELFLEFEMLKNQLSSRGNIGKETVFLLNKTADLLSEWGYTDSIVLTNFLSDDDINKLSEERLILCIKNDCQIDNYIDGILPYQKILFNGIHIVYDHSTKESFNPMLIMLNILL